MSKRSLIFFGLSLVSLVITLAIFFRWLDIKAILFLLFGLATVLLFRQGVYEMRKKK